MSAYIELAIENFEEINFEDLKTECEIWTTEMQV